MDQQHENKPDQAQPVIESYTLQELAEMLDTSPDGPAYYCVDPMRDPRTKHKLIDPRSVLKATAVRHMFENWSLDRDSIIRVTQDLDLLGVGDDSAKTIAYFAAQFHYYLMKIFTQDKATYKPEVQGLVTSAVEMLDTVFNCDNIAEVRVGPDDVRPFSSYYDHLVNTAVYWLATFCALNRKFEQSPGSIAVWRSRDKNELRQISGPYGELPKNLVLYYDIYSRDTVASELAAKKKGDLGLVTSGFYGAIFHDLGLLGQPSIVTSQEGKTTELLMNHMDESTALLKKKLGILYDERPLTRSIIKNHHERIDGSGYPRRIKDPHLFAQILSVCDAYDELCSKFPRGKVIHYLARAAGRWIDGDIVRAFLSILQPYLPGEHVEVYEGKGGDPVMSAQVVRLGKNHLRPVIKITNALNPAFESRVDAELDLAEGQNITFFV